MEKFQFDLQLFGGGGKKTGSSSSSYKPSAQELKMQNLALDYGQAASPIALNLLSQFGDVSSGNIYGLQNQDYGAMADKAISQIGNAQGNMANLANGELPTGYQNNMAASIKGGLENSLGSIVNGLGQRGVVNSSVTNKAISDMSGSVAGALAQNYNQSMGTAANLAGQQASLATAPIAATAQAQQASLIPAQSALGLSTQVENAGVTQPLAAFKGTGTQTQTQSTPWGAVFGNLAGTALGGYTTGLGIGAAL